MKFKLVLLCAASVLIGLGCESKPEEKPEKTSKAAKVVEAPKTEEKKAPADTLGQIALSSSAFEEGAEIPTQYTCDGDNTSVPLAWSNLPEGTQSVAVVMHDPDAPSGTVYHWGIWAIPPEASGLPEGLANTAEVSMSLAEDAKVNVYQSKNIAKTLGYTGPCPPEADDAHRYIFEVFALDHPGTSFIEPPSAEALLSELQADAQARGRLTGTYKRQK